MEKFCGGGGWVREQWGMGEVFLTSGTICPGFINTRLVLLIAGCLFWPAALWNIWEFNSILLPPLPVLRFGEGHMMSLRVKLCLFHIFSFPPTRPAWDRLWGGSAVGTGYGHMGECPHSIPLSLCILRGQPWSVGADFPVSCISPDIFHFEIRMVLKKTCAHLCNPGLASLGELRPGQGKECACGGSALTKLPCTLFLGIVWTLQSQLFWDLSPTSPIF